jgi:hypothetical protein
MAHVVLRKKNGSRGAIIAALRQTCQLTDKSRLYRWLVVAKALFEIRQFLRNQFLKSGGPLNGTMSYRVSKTKISNF